MVASLIVGQWSSWTCRCHRKTCSDLCVKHQRVNKMEQFDLYNELCLSYQTEVTGDGPLLSTKSHLGCNEGAQPGVASVKKKRPPINISTY